MTHTLDPSCYERIRPLLADAEHALAVDAVVERTAPGWVRVDDVGSPRAALVATPEGHYVLGRPDGDRVVDGLRAFLLDRLIPEARADGWRALVLHYWPDAWREPLGAMLPDADCKEDFQHFFSWAGPVPACSAEPPEGWRVKRIDRSALERDDLANAEHARRWAQGNFGSIDEFLDHGFGFCVLGDDVMASWCLADCVSGDRCEVGIHTDPRFRRRGFATLAVNAAVGHALSVGLARIGWHCWHENAASAATARKAGFKWVRDHRAFWVRLDA